MSNHPDFDQYGYHVIQELGRNREAGRITYLAKALNSNQKVVIKEFRFALADSSWSGYKAYQREIEVLQQLDHPRIPRYLDSFETPQGFCLVQEYKNAPSLAQRRRFTPEQIQQVVVSVLEILIDLQKRVPPIIHRDIKPENILVDNQSNAYLVDFGFARIRGGDMALSSVAAGTLGFMPPEEQFGRPLTEASDLYSLGVTLICLLTNTRSLNIGNLIDDNYRFDIKKLVPQLNPSFIAWLEKMVEPNVKQRFKNAEVALEALKSKRWVGKADRVENLVGVSKGRTLTYVVGLATLGIVAWVGTTVITPQPEKQLLESQPERRLLESQPEKQLLERNRCLGCNLQGADLEYANLTGAGLKHANLKDANLKRAGLGHANLKDANLEGANLASANLEYTNLKDANLEGANLAGANLINTSLEGANLKNANLMATNLQYAILWDADLEGADLTNANLTVAHLGNADLEYANLLDANLKGANLKGANLKGAIMPDGTQHP
mgnify:CR=1 FL=1